MGNEELDTQGRPPRFFQDQLVELISASRAFAVAEDVDSITILLSDWLPSIRQLLADALAVLDSLENLAELANNGLVDVRQQWSRSTGVLIAPRAFEELADLCFIASTECRACQKQLEPMSSDSQPFTLLVVMERAQSRLSSSLCAVEVRLARMSGRTSQTRHVDLGRQSLRARGLIARFRRRLNSTAPQTGDDLQRTVRSIGNCFAWLLGHDHFSTLRASDRLTAKMLQQRTLSWLRCEDVRDEDGIRLWQDVSTFARLLELINRRPEIVQHDYKIVLEVTSVLADSDPHSPPPCAVVEPLYRILGRDELLDSMLGSDVDTARLLARLLEIYSLLAREGADFEDSGPAPPTGSSSNPGGTSGSKSTYSKSSSRPIVARADKATCLQKRSRAVA